MRKINFIAITLFLLISCNSEKYITDLIPQAEENFSNKYLKNVKEGKLDSAIYMMSDSLRTDDGNRILEWLSSILVETDSVKLLTFNTSTTKALYTSNDDSSLNIKNTDLTYKVNFDSFFILLNINIENRNNSLEIAGLHFKSSHEPFDEYISFSFTEAIWPDYLFLLIAIVIPVVILYTLILLYKSDFKKKWLWVIFIIFGFFNFKYFWETHSLGFNLLNFQFFGSGFVRPDIFSPHIIIFSLPIGVITFLFLRKKRINIQNRAKVLLNMEFLPDKVNCPNCTKLLELEDDEIKSKKFECPICNYKFDVEQYKT